MLFVQGTIEVGVFLAPGESETAVIGPGDVGFAPQGSGHYLRNVGQDFVSALPCCATNAAVLLLIAAQDKTCTTSILLSGVTCHHVHVGC